MYLNQIIAKNVNLSDARLSDITFYKGDFQRADLSNVVGIDLKFDGTDLKHANMRGAGFTGGYFHSAQMQYVDLGSSNFLGVDLAGSVMIGAHLPYANLMGTSLPHPINSALTEGCSGCDETL